MKPWILHCDEVSEKVSAAMDGPLPLAERMKVWMHLLMCKYCMRYFRQLKLIHKACQNDDPFNMDSDIMLSSQAKERIKAALRKCDQK